MQRSRKELLIEGLLFFCSVWALLPLQAAAHLDPTAAQQLGQLATEWINQFGQSAVVLNSSLSKHGLCSGYGELLLPLRQQGQQLLFTQLGLQHDSLQTNYNIGVGQRHLTRSPGYWGYNLFYDYRRQGKHSRLGLGLERHGTQGMIRLNGYLPLSNWRSDAKNTLQSRPAKGIDLQLQRTICQQPYLQVQLLLAHYFNHSLARVASPSPPGSSTATLGFNYAPVPLFNASYGYQISSSSLHTHQVQFGLIYRLGVPLAQQFDPHQVVNAYSLNNSHFELIKRQAQIVLQQRSAPVVPAAEPEEPKATLQISIPGTQSGSPGQALLFKASALTSSSPLSDWNFAITGTFAEQGGSLQSVDFEKWQFIVRLPQQPGTYGLQLIATNPKGITAFSNNMLITVKTVEPLSDHRDKSATGQAIPDPKSPSPTTTTVPQPDSIVNDDPKLSQHLAPSGFSEKTPITEEASYSESSDRRDLDPRRGSIMSVSTTTSNEGIVAPRTPTRAYQLDVKNISEYSEQLFSYYKFKMAKIEKTLKTGEVKKTYPKPGSDNPSINLNNISAEELLRIHGVDETIAARIFFIRKITHRKGTNKQYGEGLLLSDLSDNEDKIKGINSSLREETKCFLLGENYGKK